MAAQPKPVPETKQNLTLSLSKETIRKAKILAAQRGVSMSRLIAELIVDFVDSDEDFQVRRRRAIARMKKGLPGGGDFQFDRASLYDV